MKRADRSGAQRPDRGSPAPVEYDRDVREVGYFNDAVFAIAMTLLIVGIRVPATTTTATLGHALRGLGSSLASYAISFIVIGLYWLGYHRQLHFVERLDGGALVLDLIFLMSVAFIPLPTLLLNRYFGSVSVIFYASSLAATGILLAAQWVYAGRRGSLRDVDRRLRAYYTLRALYAPLIFLLSIPVAIASPAAAMYTWLLVFPGRWIIRRLVYRR